QSCWNRKGPSPNCSHRHIHRIVRQRSVICHHWSRVQLHIAPVVACFLTPRHPMLCIALGDVRFRCSCSMETHSMKLSIQCCANVKATRSLEVFSY
ncbi:unnamed protein product, partial [Staurois parvus]